MNGLDLLIDQIPMQRGSDSFINQNSVLCVEVAISHHTEVLVIIMCARLKTISPIDGSVQQFCQHLL